MLLLACLQALLASAGAHPASDAAQAALHKLLMRLLQQQQQQPAGSHAASAALSGGDGVPASNAAAAPPSSLISSTTLPAAADAQAAAEREAAAKQAVEAIRAREFGVGLGLKGPAGQLMAAQNARLGRALQRLSQELYSSSSHFVLELVQVCYITCYCVT